MCGFPSARHLVAQLDSISRPTDICADGSSCWLRSRPVPLGLFGDFPCGLLNRRPSVLAEASPPRKAPIDLRYVTRSDSGATSVKLARSQRRYLF